MIAQKLTHKPVVFRGDAQTEAVGAAEGSGGGVKIVKRADIDPELRDCDDQWLIRTFVLLLWF